MQGVELREKRRAFLERERLRREEEAASRVHEVCGQRIEGSAAEETALASSAPTHYPSHPNPTGTIGCRGSGAGPYCPRGNVPRGIGP